MHACLFSFVYLIDLSPPKNISVTSSEIVSSEIKISWDLVSTCTSIPNVTYMYNVNTSNCGMCSNITTINFTVCNITPSAAQVMRCTVTIQTVVCGIFGNASEEYTVSVGSKSMMPKKSNYYRYYHSSITQILMLRVYLA